jgi:hypothetical protein
MAASFAHSSSDRHGYFDEIGEGAPKVRPILHDAADIGPEEPS